MEKKVIRIHHGIDVAAAQHAAKEVARSVGFNDQESEEIALVVGELASNQVKHANGGTVTIKLIQEDSPGVQIEAMDDGPGIENIDQALSDGFSTAGSLGLGLGSINRLMDQVDVQSQPGQGTRITCKRSLRILRQGISPLPLDIGVATRPLLGMSVNGDGFVVKHWQDHALIGVIDGLGHGQFAHLAAEMARQYVETHADQSLDALFRGTARACLATRGVVMALARFEFLENYTSSGDLADSNDVLLTPAPKPRFFYASIGNIEVRLLGSSEPVFFNLRRGVVGSNTPNVVVTEHSWKKDNILIIHSDGLTTRWHPKNFPNLPLSPASELAQELLNSLSKQDDDATVIVIKNGRKEGI